MSSEQPDIAGPGYDFVSRQLELLGDQDPLAVLERTPVAVTVLVDAHPVSAWRHQAATGKWTPGEILWHMAVTDWIFREASGPTP